jgi:nucleoside diphosphate kinase
VTASKVDWNRFVLLLITPDALVRHLAVPLLEHVEHIGLRPARFRLVEPGPEEIDRLYKVNIDFVWETYRYRSVDLMFKHGPSLAVLLEDELQADGSGHGRLMDAKGKGALHEASADSIRRRLRSINVILSLMHTSASPEDAEREAPIFFDRPVLGVAARPTFEQPGESIWDFCRLLELSTPAETREFDDVLAGFRTKLATALWELFRPEGQELLIEWSAEGPDRFAESGAGARLAAQLDDECEPLLRAALASEFEPDPDAPLRVERVWPLLEGYGIPIDRWERLVLSTSLYFRPWRRREEVGERPLATEATT